MVKNHPIDSMVDWSNQFVLIYHATGIGVNISGNKKKRFLDNLD